MGQRRCASSMLVMASSSVIGNAVTYPLIYTITCSVTTCLEMSIGLPTFTSSPVHTGRNAGNGISDVHRLCHGWRKAKRQSLQPAIFFSVCVCFIDLLPKMFWHWHVWLISKLSYFCHKGNFRPLKKKKKKTSFLLFVCWDYCQHTLLLYRSV